MNPIRLNSLRRHAPKPAPTQEDAPAEPADAAPPAPVKKAAAKKAKRSKKRVKK